MPSLNRAGRYLRCISKQYLILIEDLVRQGRSEREIDEIVREIVAEDERVEASTETADRPDLPAAA